MARPGGAQTDTGEFATKAAGDSHISLRNCRPVQSYVKDYNPLTQQFISRDPSGASAGQPYVYANRNPVNYIDPTGTTALFNDEGGGEIPPSGRVPQSPVGAGSTVEGGGGGAGAAEAALEATVGAAAPPTLGQVRALREIGLTRVERRAFFTGDWVAYETPSEGGVPTIAAIRLEGQTLRSGIISIVNSTGTGLQDLVRFRAQSFVVAKAFGASETQIFGGAFINQGFESNLLRLGFTPNTAVVPDALGGGTMDILSRIYSNR